MSQTCIPSKGNSTDLYRTPMTPSDDENEDEWWNEEVSIVSRPDQAQIASSRTTKWPGMLGPSSLSPSMSFQPHSTKNMRCNSVRKPTREKLKHRQRKQNARAGIKVITDFSKHHHPTPATQQSTLPRNLTRQPGCFVDLAALQALDVDAPSNTGGFWQSIAGRALDNNAKGQQKDNLSLCNNKMPETGLSRVFSSRQHENSIHRSLRREGDLSPSDRPIVIGISTPSASLAQHVASPQTAASDASNIIKNNASRSPELGPLVTPAVIVTPAQEPSLWSVKDIIGSKPYTRVASSVYSRADNGVSDSPAHIIIPPVSQMPIFLSGKREGSRSEPVLATRDSVTTLFDENHESQPSSPLKPRVLSSCTIFEEDETPLSDSKNQTAADTGALARPMSGALVSQDRGSRGWWNHILTPFLTRSNTFVSSQAAVHEQPNLPSLAIAAIQAQSDGRDAKTWEKAFSPVTPTTSTTIASDTWWSKRNTTDGMRKMAESENNTYRSEDYGSLPFMLSTAGLGILEGTTNPSEEQQTSSSLPIPQVQKGNASNDPRNSIIIPVDRETSALHEAGTKDVATTNDSTLQPQANTLHQHVMTERPQMVNIAAPASTTVVLVPSEVVVPQPPPYSPGNFPRYHAVHPPRQLTRLPEPLSPSPISPGLQQAMGTRGEIALADVVLTPPARQPPINLNTGYPVVRSHEGLPYLTAVEMRRNAKISEKSRKLEAKRRRHEREDAVAHKVGGLWRGRGCISNRGCYGRGGVEGRKRRRCWFGLIAGFLSLIILTLVLVTQLHRTSAMEIQPSQWLNLTNFPPIYTEISTVAVPQNVVTNSGCFFPATAWSCALPKELQAFITPNQPNQPNFRFRIQWDNSSSTNATYNITNSRIAASRTVGNAVSARQFVRKLLGRAGDVPAFTPIPTPPSFAEQNFLGNTTDGIVSSVKIGESTPFYITFLSTRNTSLPSKSLTERQSINLTTGAFPNLTDFIPRPDLNPDGTVAPANLLPLPIQQPLRLYDRGLSTEHYGFYNYFNRTIFLKSTRLLNSSNLGDGEVPDDENGGCTEKEAAWRVTWAQTRFLVQIWTRKGPSAALLKPTGAPSAIPLAPQNVDNFSRPGSFPYPVTITTDRHGGDPSLKFVYAYGLDSREHVTGIPQILGEHRDNGGKRINPAPSLFNNSTGSNQALGGFDGGTSGCSCQWSNWQNVIKG